MKITVKNYLKSRQFEEVYEGEIFSLVKENFKHFYLKLPMKTDENEDIFNAFCFSDQEYYYFLNEEKVKRYKAELILEED